LSGRTEIDELYDLLKDLEKEDRGMIVKTRVDGDKINLIYIQTGEMAQKLNHFPEVLLMDATYCVNNRRMPLIIFMVMDGHGNGCVVAFCFVSDERQETVEAAVKIFVENNSGALSKTVTAVVDKDYSEISAIEKLLPNVHVHLCRFHVQKTFKSMTVNEPRKSEIRRILNDMVYCSSLNAYDKLLEELFSLASASFRDYFEKNWNNCPQSWTNVDRVSILRRY
jgi:hypothetical protein